MLEYLKNAANRTRTENGAATYATTFSDCLDLFATIGALRHSSDREIAERFARAFAEDRDMAMKLLFFARDVRGGLGERRVFRVCLRWLAHNAPDSVKKNIPCIAEFGRWDDLLCLLDTPCQPEALMCIRHQLQADLVAMEQGGEVSLLGKWLPSVNTSNAQAVRNAKRIARYLGMNDAAYRKTVVSLRKHIHILENTLRLRDYTFDYAKQPSRAMFKYRDAFWRNDGERYTAFLEQVKRGDASMHTGALTPYEVIRPLLEDTVSQQDAEAVDVTWNALENFAGGENALVVIDGSGSMYCYDNPMPAAVALSLGIYFAERNTGAFRDHFITFSETPQLVQIKGNTIAEKVAYCSRFNEVANTNIQKVFELILDAAVKNQVPQEEMPSTLYIISDMEFDFCTEDASLTNFEYARQLFALAGYQLPRVVFWNVDSRRAQQPVTQNTQGVALVSGCTPRIFDMLKSGSISPLGYMLEILSAERYAGIAA